MSDLNDVFAEALVEHRIDDDEECPSGCDVHSEERLHLTTSEVRLEHWAEAIAATASDQLAGVWNDGWGNGHKYRATNGREGLADNPYERKNP